MNLPLANPPFHWSVKKQGTKVLIQKSMAGGTGLPSNSTMVVSGIAIFLAITVFQFLTSSEGLIEVLISARTLIALVLIGAGIAIAIRATNSMAEWEVLTLEPHQISKKSRRLGDEKFVTLEKNRVMRVVHSLPRNRDGSRCDGGSVELEYRDQGGENLEFYVMYSNSTAEVSWFVTLMEAWSGMRARVEDYVIDSDDEDEEDFEIGTDSGESAESRNS